jgi:hypothetical protein
VKALDEVLKQSEKYNLKKIPVLLFKENNMRGKLVVIGLSDFQQIFIGQKNALIMVTRRLHNLCKARNIKAS